MMFYQVVLLSCRSLIVGQSVTDTELATVENIGVSTLEDGRDTELTVVGNNGVSSLEDGRDTDMTTVGNINVSTQEDGTDMSPS